MGRGWWRWIRFRGFELSLFLIIFPFRFRDTLTEIDMDSSIVDKNVIHRQIGLLGILFVFVLDKGIAERVARLLVPHDFATEDFAESTEDGLQIFVRRHLIQFTDE